MGHYFMVLKASKAMNTGFWYQKFFFIPIPASPYFCFIFISPHSIFLSLLKYPLSSESFNAILIQPYIKNTSEYFKILKKNYNETRIKTGPYAISLIVISLMV